MGGGGQYEGGDVGTSLAWVWDRDVNAGVSKGGQDLHTSPSPRHARRPVRERDGNGNDGAQPASLAASWARWTAGHGGVMPGPVLAPVRGHDPGRGLR
jgi:hypothetical protein